MTASIGASASVSSVTTVDTSPGRRSRGVTGYLRWWPLAAVAAVNVLVLVEGLSPVRATLVLPLVVLLPGHLTLRLTRVRRPSAPDRILHTVATGVLWLIAVSFLLGLLGALRPVWCLVAFDVVTAGLGTAAVLRRRPPAPSTPDAFQFRAVPPAAAVAVVLAAGSVALAVAGARHLNAGGSGILTQCALAAGAVALLLVVIAARAPADSGSDRAVATVAACVVYVLGLAVLLATSLRGVGVTGHDIKPEFRVFQDALAAGGWRAGDSALTDYHSCLSITTLPTLLHHLLGVAPLDVFRVCDQVIFAAVPVGVLLIARTVVPTAAATLAAGLYVAFPTFVNDMPMLNRQEFALLFFTVAVLALVGTYPTRRQRTAVFAAMVAGLTVSHYSSTYVMGAVLLCAWLLLKVGRLVHRRVPARGRHTRLLDAVDLHLSRVTLPRSRPSGPHLLTVRAVAIVLLSSALWSLVSGSGAGLVTTVRTTAAAVISGGGTESDAVAYSFLRRGPAVSDEQALTEFISANGARPDRAVQARYAATCPIQREPEASVPRTRAGDVLAAVGAAPETINVWWRRLAVVLYQFGALAGTVLFALYGIRGAGNARLLAVLGAAAHAVLAATVVLPQISVDYGLLRLFQQSLVVLAPAVVLALTGAARLLGARAAALVSALVVTGCLVSTSGLGPQLIGGFPPQLNLNNSGAYHRAYATSADDLDVARWVDTHLGAGVLLSADSADFRTLRSTTRLYPLEGVAPGMVPAEAYLQVTTAGPDRAEAVAIARDRIITYTFRLSCVTGGRPLLYGAGVHRVYGPAS
jgi:hypothetical protein